MKFKLSARSNGKTYKYIDNLPLEELIKLKHNIEKEFLLSLGIDEDLVRYKNKRILDTEKSLQSLIDERKMEIERYHRKLKTLGNSKIIIPIEHSATLQALNYLNDIAHGMKLRYDPQFLKDQIEEQVLAFELIKKCFKLNGFDELIPNENWWDSETIQEFVKKVLKQ